MSSGFFCSFLWLTLFTKFILVSVLVRQFNCCFVLCNFMHTTHSGNTGNEINMFLYILNIRFNLVNFFSNMWNNSKKNPSMIVFWSQQLYECEVCAYSFLNWMWHWKRNGDFITEEFNFKRIRNNTIDYWNFYNKDFDLPLRIACIFLIWTNQNDKLKLFVAPKELPKITF